MAPIMRATLALLVLASSAGAVTLTVTSDKSTYLVGETITLSVLGDAEGATALSVHGLLLFDEGLADHVSSAQTALTSFGGFITWFQGTLFGGEGFGDAFVQVGGSSPMPVDGPLFASVVLIATNPGTLAYGWDTDFPDPLSFFEVSNPPGGSVTIVPEPATALLLAVGLLGLAQPLRRPDRPRGRRPLRLERLHSVGAVELRSKTVPAA